jgi:hypothetical protein
VVVVAGIVGGGLGGDGVEVVIVHGRGRPRGDVSLHSRRLPPPPGLLLLGPPVTSGWFQRSEGPPPSEGVVQSRWQQRRCRGGGHTMCGMAARISREKQGRGK